MMQYLRTIGSFLLLLSLICTTAIFAQTPPPSMQHTHLPTTAMQLPKVHIISLGAFTARGSGTANVSMQQGTLTIAGQGELRLSGDAKVTFTGTPGKKVEPKFGMPPGRSPRAGMMGSVTYQGFNGEAKVSGSHFYFASLHGSNIVVSAQGAGTAFVMGEGSYTCTKNGAAGKETGKWMAPPKPQPGTVAFGGENSAGTLAAKGSGVVNISMRKGTLTIAGQGDFMVSSDAKVTFKGNPGKKIEPNVGKPSGKSPHGARAIGNVTYQGFNGEAKISGSRFYFVNLRGNGLVVSAQGAGNAFLMGTGSYTGTKNGSAGKATGAWGAKPKPQPGNVSFGGGLSTGTLSASGSGMVNVSMQQGTLTIAGQGDLMLSSDAKVTFTGNPGKKSEPNAGTPSRKAPRGAGMLGPVTYKGFNGEAKVSGSHLYFASLHGSGIVLSAQGIGYAFLMGTGSYTGTTNGTAGKETGKWRAQNGPGAHTQHPGAPGSTHSSIIKFGDFSYPMQGNIGHPLPHAPQH